MSTENSSKNFSLLHKQVTSEGENQHTHLCLGFQCHTFAKHQTRKLEGSTTSCCLGTIFIVCLFVFVLAGTQNLIHAVSPIPLIPRVTLKWKKDPTKSLQLTWHN